MLFMSKVKWQLLYMSCTPVFSLWKANSFGISIPSSKKISEIFFTITFFTNNFRFTEYCRNIFHLDIHWEKNPTENCEERPGFWFRNAYCHQRNLQFSSAHLSNSQALHFQLHKSHFPMYGLTTKENALSSLWCLESIHGMMHADHSTSLFSAAAYQLQVKRKKIKIFRYFKIVKFISGHKKIGISLEIIFYISLIDNFTVHI